MACSTRDRTCVTRPEGALRVAVLSRAPFVGGAEVAAERLAVGLGRAGHVVRVFAGVEGEVSQRLREAGLDVVVTDLPQRDRCHAWRYLRAGRALRREVRRFSPHVIHANDLPTHQLTAEATRGLGAPRLCHHRFLYDDQAIRWMLRGGVERHLFVSDGLRRLLVDASPTIAATPGAVVYDGLELPDVPDEAQRRDARRRLGLPADRVIVTFAGQMIERKGIDELLHAWRRLDNQWHGLAELVLLGDDPATSHGYRAAMQRLAADLGLDVRFTGFRRDVADWLAASDVSVTPSRAEPLGNAVLEAMAMALPVIGGDVGGIPEMVVAGETGRLIPPRDPEALARALDACLGDEAGRRAMGAAGRRRCETLFSLEAHTSAVLRQYDIALGRAADAPAGRVAA